MATYYYIIRNVPANKPNPTSYPIGRTLFGGGYRTEAEANAVCDRWNRFRACDNFKYHVEAHDDLTEKVDCDHYEQR